MKQYPNVVDALCLVPMVLCLLYSSAIAVPHSTSTIIPKPVNIRSSASVAATSPSRQMSRGDYLAKTALNYRGYNYRFGGEGPRGYDCSGLTQTVYRKYGMMIPRIAVDQFHKGAPISKDKLMTGDLVFFKNTYKSGISHVGIFVGEGKFLHAASTRKGVIVSKLSEPYYINRYAGARRLTKE